ncbi:MAG: GntR family transcriptional regulator [Synergistaceae bacterium]|nr:GntR family transcriptional regulator [Synergistaceae bacterium]
MIYEKVKNDIVDMKRPPKTFVLERQLAEEFSTSRTPVREAIKRLMQEGWLTGEDRCRSQVSELTELRCREVFAVRNMIENYALIDTFTKGNCRALAGKLDTEIKKMENLKNDPIAFVHADLNFHTVIVEHVGNGILSRIWQSISDEITRISIFSMDKERQPDIIIAEHNCIMQALWNENPQELISLDRHMKLIMDGLSRTLQKG